MNPQTTPPGVSPRKPVPPSGPQPTLLFVDDDERILRSLRMMFAANYRVLVTTNGHEALGILKREKVHALISDQRMPIMLGVDLLRQAREIAPDTMRLLLTGYSDIEAVIGSINDGEVFRYINKPWNADDIRAIIGEAAEIALSLEQPTEQETPHQAEEHAHGMLLIDDSPEIASDLRALVEDSFPGTFRLEWATSLGEAVAILERVNLSIVISEIHVNGQDLTSFLKTLKHFHPHVVTIVLTSFKDTSLLVELINQGQVHRFLPKPVRKVMTVRGIQSGIERSREIQTRPELTRRNKVEAPKKGLDPNIVNRIRGLFKGLGAARD